MKEFTGGLIQKDTTLIETGYSEPSHIPETKKEKKEGIHASRWFSWLKNFSFG